MICRRFVSIVRFSRALSGVGGWLGAVLTCLGLALTACESDVEGGYVGIQESVPVMACFAQVGQPLSVSVYGSVGYNDTVSYPPLGSVVVHVSLGDSLSLRRSMPRGATSVIFPSLYPQPGDSLSITASIDNVVVASSSTTMPSVPHISSLAVALSSGAAHAGLINLAMEVHDSTPQTDYYLVEVRNRIWKDGHATDSIASVDYHSAAFQSNFSSMLGRFSRIGVFSDQSFSHGSVRLSFSCLARSVQQAADADSVRTFVRLSHISSDYYLYILSSCISDFYVLLPVFGTSIVHSNVSGGYGIVASMAYDEVPVVIDGVLPD